VLVVGGSQGARALNEIVPGAIALLPGACPVEVHHQSGEAELEATRERYRVLGARAEVSAFIDAIAAAYAWADVVICRAGAMTVAELAAAGAPAILVPYPHAVDDHQTRNARYLVEAGAALLLPQAELEPARLADWIAGLHAARGRLLEMAECARRVALPDATERVVAACVEVARG
jgi:UDP-N-acetylglucosamine--N-acetylmuramyl-(pentapeptide) pyrophosphoryl-undecaprenol N-acetylglucosamine transferase